jgi:hypothetical protein
VITLKNLLNNSLLSACYISTTNPKNNHTETKPKEQLENITLKQKQYSNTIQDKTRQDKTRQAQQVAKHFYTFSCLIIILIAQTKPFLSKLISINYFPSLYLFRHHKTHNKPNKYQFCL